MGSPNNQTNPDSAIPVYIAGGSGHGSGWAKTADGTPLTTTTPATVMAAAGAGLRQYVTGIQLMNADNTDSAVKVLDGTTIIWETYLLGKSANGASAQGITFTTPIVCSDNTALTIQAVTAGCAVYWNIQGFTAP